MKDILRKYIWLPIAIMLGLGIWYFLKAKVYDIKVPEKPLTYKLWEQVWVLPGSGTANFWGKIDFLSVEYDSITWPKGLELLKRMNHYSDHKIEYNLLKWPEGTLPLQVAKVWKNGFPYYCVLSVPDLVANDTIYPWGNIPITYLQDKNIANGEKLCEIYKENFDENKIVLTLEKPDPVKIVALWENYAITGETDGKTIKIIVPRIATKYQYSLIRVWACDSAHVSRPCEIPLHYGIIPNKMEGAIPREQLRQERLVGGILDFSDFKANGDNFLELYTKIGSFLKDEYEPILTYGDLRALVLQNGARIAMLSYFGKKIVFVFNNSDQKSEISFPFKGDLKHSANGTVFKLKGSNLMLTLPAKSYEILY